MSALAVGFVGWSSVAACSTAEARRTFSPCWSVSTTNGATPGADTDATAPTVVSSSSSNNSSKRMSRTSEASPRTARAADKAISQ